ncbi:unnamed protein product [Ceutorhynchus assimilis]|uniref:Uncharacterized protein n=1 Tax=Ceutorhynchus assimilis TaxID=467358 RepID=A0A9N9QSX5_9CUCU|nr:unnamed protein product [Ceutorhynchus assimilis]
MSHCLARDRDLIFNSEYGIILEKIGVSYIHYGHIYIPITFSLPQEINIQTSYNIDHTAHCDYQKSINDRITVINDFLKYIVPNKMYSSYKPNADSSLRNPRNKRLIPFAALGASTLSLGVSAWNRYDISGIKDKISEIEKHNNLINNKISQIVMYSNTIISEFNKVHHIVSEHTNSINKIIEGLNCTSQSLYELDTFLSSWANYVPMEFIRALDFAFLGKIVPDLIPYSSLIKILINTKELSSGPYMMDPTLAYQLGDFLLLDINTAPYSIIGIMVLPHLLSSSVGDLYQVGTVSWKNGSYMHKFHLPSIISHIPNKGGFWYPDPVDCVNYPFYTICPNNIMTITEDYCLTNIMLMNNTNDCSITTKKYNDEDRIDIYQMRSGLLIGSSDEVVTIFRNADHEVSTKMHLLENATIFLTPDMGESLIYKNDLYSIGIHHDPVKITTFNVSFNYYHHDDLVKMKEDTWVDISTLPEEDSYSDIQNGHSALIATTMVLTIISIVGVYILLMKYKLYERVLAAIIDDRKDDTLMPISQGA